LKVEISIEFNFQIGHVCDSQHLNNPLDVAVNDTQGVIYVVDSNNHRIMRYIIGSSNGTVVAGGNGLGNARK